MKKTVHLFALLLLIIGLSSCAPDRKKTAKNQEETTSMVRKYNDDGTLSSINPVDEKGYVDGVKINYYEDGKTIHSQVTYEHGRKHGPAIWYYKNGQVHEHTSYYFGRKQGLTKKYYPTGELMEELTYEQGEVQPGARKFDRQGKEMK
jgi:antitoxin component YwqK of YwqJK toxin-antitoxin module